MVEARPSGTVSGCGKRPAIVVVSKPCSGSFTTVEGRSGEMADATDSKSVARKGVWVQVPPPVLQNRRERAGFAIGRPLVLTP